MLTIIAMSFLELARQAASSVIKTLGIEPEIQRATGIAQSIQVPSKLQSAGQTSWLAALNAAKTVGGKPGIFAAGAAAAGIGAIALLRRRKKARVAPARKAPSKRAKPRKKGRGKKSKRRTEAGELSPAPSKQKIRFTKKGQPFIMVTRTIKGKSRRMAQFIKKSTAKAAKSRKGGLK